MADIADRAEELERLEREEALARHAQAAAETEPPFEIEGRRVCLDCFEPLAKRRLKAAPRAVRCVDCQTEHDDRRGRRRGTA